MPLNDADKKWFNGFGEALKGWIREEIDTVAADVWGYRLEHPLAKVDGRPAMIPAGTYQRLDSAEHANTRAAIVATAGSPVDVDATVVANRIAAQLKKLGINDPQAVAIATADELDKRDAKAIADRKR